MAHPSQREFVEDCKRRFPEFFMYVRVLEIGARNVNGTVRDLFWCSDYVGLDAVDGPDVDVVALAHEFTTPEPFDIVLSCEAFEHDPHLPKTLANIAKLLRPGGLFVATFAGPDRPEHGTSATGEAYGPDADYYQNISPEQFDAMVKQDYLPRRVVTPKRRDGKVEDVYFWGIKSV